MYAADLFDEGGTGSKAVCPEAVSAGNTRKGSGTSGHEVASYRGVRTGLFYREGRWQAVIFGFLFRYGEPADVDIDIWGPDGGSGTGRSERQTP